MRQCFMLRTGQRLGLTIGDKEIDITDQLREKGSLYPGLYL